MRGFETHAHDGFTHVIDKGLGPRAWEDVLETSGDYIDIVKLGWGTSYVTKNLRAKLDLLREKPIVIGGTFFEAVVARDRVEEYKGWLKELGLTLLGSRSAYLSGLGEGYEDKILIHRDKNPNTKGVLELVPDVKPLTSLVTDIETGRVTHVIALGKDALLVRGTSSDNGTIAKVVVNGANVKATRPNFAEWEVTLTGVVKAFQYTNPHSWLLVDVTAPDGKVTTWGFEAEGPSTLMRAGIRISDFTPGTPLTITGHPMRDGRPAATWIKATRATDKKEFVPQAGFAIR